MLPTYRQLKLQLWWILSDPSESHDRYLKEYRAFFSEQAPLLDVDATFSFGEVCCKQSRNRYEESIYQVDCAIEWPGITWFGPCAKHLQLGHAWCNAGRDQGSNKALFQWLVLSPLEGFQLATRPLDWNVSLLSFSFGTLAELGTYVQHHQFSTYLYRGHPNYWVDSTFQHDQCSLHIDLHLNHRSGCEDHVAERRFVVPYLNVLKVLINEKRFIELYLHLKIPPMLMGKVVSDIPARPGSAAAAAPLCLERYLAIGCNCIGGAVRMASLCGGLFLKLVVRDHSLARHVRGRLSQRFAHGTLICYAPVWIYSSQDAWSLEDQVRCEVQRTLQFPCAFAFKANLYTAFDVLDQMVLMSGSEFNKLVREIETRSEKEPLVVSSIDAGNVVVFSRAFYAACSLFHDKPPQLARGTCLVPSTQHLCYTRPAHLSPCAGPLREQEFAIRMSFRDDNLDKLSFTLNLHSSLDALLDAVVGSFLRQGVYDVMKLTDCPSAMQIRYAGSKGMLCLNPALPNKKLLGLWPSMLKFPCTSSEYLDVVKVSASRSVTLNLPLITILEHLGVRTDTFIRLQENIQFTDALVEESSAVNVLAVWSKLPLLYEDLSMAGFRLALDPFFRSLLLAVYRNAVAGLWYKTRIVLPVDRAHNMLGVVDTTNKHRYGECTEIRRPHVQYHELPKRTVITGTVLVTKCPCLHLGYVRKFTAIDVPELHHVIDCIVFPAHGPRPHPDEMAGSDLDGDEYIVIWEKCLFFVGLNRPPMNYSDRNPEPDNKEITTDDMIKFFWNCIKNDSIGILSNAQLAWADQEPGGIHSPRCFAIAEKISICLDFAKNGQTAFLRRDERPLLYPHFMEKDSHKTTYRSDRVLGVVYRMCRSLETVVGRLGHLHVDPGHCRALTMPGWENYRESVIQALTDYNSNIRRILSQYGIGSEGDVTKFLTETTRNIFYTDVLKEMHDNCISDSEELRKRKLRRASAWYMVTCEPNVENTFFSFPWCIANVLVEILRCSDAQATVWCPNILHWKIDQLVTNNSDFTEADDLDAGCDSFRTAFRIVEKWLKDETLLDQHEPGASAKPGLCSNCLLDICTKFLGNKNLAPVGKIVMRRWHAMMLSVAEVPNLTESTAQEAMEECADREEPTEKAVSQAWQIVDGFLEPLLLDDSEDEASEPRTAYQNGHVDDQEDSEVSRSSVFPLQQASDTSNSEPDIFEDPSVGTLVVSFLRWCLEQHQLTREMCRVGACAGGGYECQTHRLPMVALRAYRSLVVSLDPCHVSLPCDPAYHKPHHEVVERDPVRIQIANPVMDQMLKDKLHVGMTSYPSWICIPPCTSRHSKSRNKDRLMVAEPMPRIALGNATAAG